MAFRHLKFILPILLLSGLTAFSVLADSMGPQQVIEQTATVLLSVMKDAKTLGFDGRFQRLSPIIQSVFNFPLMAQITAGGYWTRATSSTVRAVCTPIRAWLWCAIPPEASNP